jgi:hypothetical protein
MSFTAISDIVNPEVLADQVSAKFPDMLWIGNTNLVAVDTTFPEGSPGTVLTIPFWKRIGGFALKAETAAMTPGNITTGKERAQWARAGAAYEVYDTAELVSKADPVGEIASQIARRAAEWIDAALLTEANLTPNTYDASAAVIDQNTFITALVNTLGDNHGKMLNGGAIIMHSKVYGDLLKTAAIQNQYQSGMDILKTGNTAFLLGMPVLVSDLVTTTAASGSTPAYYESYIVGPEALALFYQRKVMVEFDRDILLQADVIAATVHYAAHLFGYDDVGGTVVAEQNKSIHLVAVKSR